MKNTDDKTNEVTETQSFADFLLDLSLKTLFLVFLAVFSFGILISLIIVKSLK